MVSEAIVTFVVERLNDLLIREAKVLPEVDGRFRLIAEQLQHLRFFLKDADERQKKDERVRNLVTQIIEVSYDTEDAIDTFIRSERAKIEHIRHGFVGCVKRPRCDVGKELRRISFKISSISVQRATWVIRNRNTAEEEAIKNWQPIFQESDVVGLQEDIKTLKGRLINGDPSRCVISLLGMGGIGKTTLAKKVFNDQIVKDNFDCLAFVFPSQPFRDRDILIDIIQCVMSPSLEEMKKLIVKDLVSILYDHLRKKRYLVVIDGIWSTEAWDAIKLALPDSSNGSRVILTTRNRHVALLAGVSYNMHLLTEDESWELFLRRIFRGENTPIARGSELEKIGRQILAKCGGLPLAILDLGDILSVNEATLHSWSQVIANVSWHLTKTLTESQRSLLAVASSYHDLYYYLKPCFLYLAAFPEDCQICSKKLMWLWTAEGFIYERDNKMIEDVGKDYLEQLSDRSMIQVGSRRSDGSVSKFCIHVLLHHLSRDEARKNNFFNLAIDDHNKNTVRRLALHDPDSERINHSTPKLRSLLCFSKSTIDLSKILMTRPKFLRVLDAEDVKFSEQKLPKEIGKLSQLRYLNLRNTCIDSLPNSIGKLIYLEILDIRGTRVRPMTATAIQKLERLRYLYMDMDDGTTDGGSLDVSSLSSLRVLSVIRVGQWMEDGLGKLIHLQKLGIYGDLYLYSFAQDLHKLENLRSLRLGLGFGDGIPELEAILSCPPDLRTLHLERPLQQLPDPDKFPTSLTKLCLKRSLLEQDPMATLERLPGLRVLKLGCGSFLGKKMVCSAGGFPELRLLELDLLDELEEWIVDEGAMPELKHLVIRLCNRLKELPQGLLHLYHQKELEVTEMPETFMARLQSNKGKEIQLKRSVTMDGNGISMGASSSSQ